MFLQSYAVEHLIEILGREHLNTYKDLLPDIKMRKTRAHIIDTLFKSAAMVKMEDKSIIYQAVSMMDRYLEYSSKTFNSLNFTPECTLIAFTSMFVASKNSEVEPLGIRDIKNVFLNRQYKVEEILEKELMIRKATKYENEVTTLFDYVMLLIKIWKLCCQNKIV